ncbi:MAG: cyclic nucleotide-binding domain-containing protein [Bacteroidetes bacterium]|nr:cyclic nucleotide-binding domain-containing protein [Bacteroidota bacterium]MCB0843046.1 cyclic nucleotide-binding domain-containing protein [Bacteroidota bacterium]MCB0850720.1 cyclic nucleotide-binding domain-containing protein [Bacteroidota bacterium]
MENNQIIEALQQSKLFSQLDINDLQEISKKAKVRQFFANDIIVWQGQPSASLFLILNGIVAVKNIIGKQEHLLAYLMPGNSFGEVGILENRPRSATVSALSEVDVLVIQRDDFLSILQKHSIVAIELARILGEYLMQSNRRMNSGKRETKFVLILNTESEVGSTGLGTLLAEKLLNFHKKPTAYMEYPTPWRALKGHQLSPGATVYHHEAGYDILLPQAESYLPVSTQVTLLLDQIMTNYDNVIIQVQDYFDEGLEGMLKHAGQVIILAPPTADGLRKTRAIRTQIKNRVRTEDTAVITVINRSKAEYKDLPIEETPDFEIPFVEEFPGFDIENRNRSEIPEAVDKVVTGFMERLERTNSIGIFIPTTTEAHKKANTQPQIDKTMGFMAERFGGATCKVAKGVWHSEKLGLIGEVVYIVHSYITQADMNRYLDEVVDFIKELKMELSQEAMALEVNNKLTLI